MAGIEIERPASRSGLFARCLSCGALIFFPRPEALAYSGDYYGIGDRKIRGAAGLIRARSVRIRARETHRWAGRAGTCLDIGCGDGDFLAAMKSMGWNVRGCELPGRAYERAASRFPGHVHCGSNFAEPYRDGEFDAVTLWQVFEHLPDPLECIRRVRRILRDGGVLAISMPDPSSWQARIGGSQWLHLDPPRHLLLQRPDQLARFLESQGFEFLGVKHPWLEFGPIGCIQTCFNLAGFSRDFFFEHLKSGWSEVPLAVRLAIGLGVFLLLPFGVLFSAVEAVFRKSATFEIFVRKKVSG